MKKCIAFLFGLILCSACTENLLAQETIDNNFAGAGNFLGWNGTDTTPLRIEHQATYSFNILIVNNK